jgi:hypothetical protein
VCERVRVRGGLITSEAEVEAFIFETEEDWPTEVCGSKTKTQETGR